MSRRVLHRQGLSKQRGFARLSTSLALGLALLLLPPTHQLRAEDSTIQVVRLVSLHWPPYSGEDLPEQGASVAVVRAALRARGHGLVVEFLPFTQAIGRAQDSRDSFHGYLPEYPSKDVETHFQLSESIGSSPLGFVEKQSAPVHWATLDDLRGQSVGLVRGYVNTAEFDRMVGAGEIIGVPAADDISNLRSVMQERVALAVVDRHVLSYLLLNTPGMNDARRVLQFNARPLKQQSLHVALQRTERGNWALREINRGLRQIDVDAILAPFFAPLGTDSSER